MYHLQFDMLFLPLGFHVLKLNNYSFLFFIIYLFSPHELKFYPGINPNQVLATKELINFSVL